MISIIRETICRRCTMCGEFKNENYEWFVITNDDEERRLCWECLLMYLFIPPQQLNITIEHHD